MLDEQKDFHCIQGLIYSASLRLRTQPLPTEGESTPQHLNCAHLSFVHDLKNAQAFLYKKNDDKESLCMTTVV